MSNKSKAVKLFITLAKTNSKKELLLIAKMFEKSRKRVR